MKLRAIILILSLLVFLSTATGGYLYFTGLKKSAFEKVEIQGVLHAEAIRDLFDEHVSSSLKAVKGLSGHREIKRVLSAPEPIAVEGANQIIDNFNSVFQAGVSYVMDLTGNTIASSNRNDPDSFVGKNYSFRPYFQKAIQGTPSVYMALGVTSGQLGIYFSQPVYSEEGEAPSGVVVMKVLVENMATGLLNLRPGAPGIITLITDPHGVIFMADRDHYLFQVLEKISDEKSAGILASKQFGASPLKWSGFEERGTGRRMDGSGIEYISVTKALASLPGGDVVYLHDVEEVLKGIYAPLKGNLGLIALSFFLFIGVSVILLYKMAQADIARRKSAEKTLQENEERFRSISFSIHDALVTMDEKGRITFWNDAAEKIFGYPKEEVMGKPLHPMLAPEKYLDEHKTGFDKFMATGTGNAVGKTLELSALRKDGFEFPIELSLASYHVNGQWHAVGTIRDISDRKSAEQERENLIHELQTALKDIRKLSGLLPICAHCKKIRDDKGYWNRIEAYIEDHSEAEFSHSICQQCARKYYPDIDLDDD